MSDGAQNSGNGQSSDGDKQARTRMVLAEWAKFQTETGATIAKMMELSSPNAAQEAANRYLASTSEAEPLLAGLVPVADQPSLNVARPEQWKAVARPNPVHITNDLLKQMNQRNVALHQLVESLLKDLDDERRKGEEERRQREEERRRAKWRERWMLWATLVSAAAAIVVPFLVG